VSWGLPSFRHRHDGQHVLPRLQQRDADDERGRDRYLRVRRHHDRRRRRTSAVPDRNDHRRRRPDRCRGHRRYHQDRCQRGRAGPGANDRRRTDVEERLQEGRLEDVHHPRRSRTRASASPTRTITAHPARPSPRPPQHKLPARRRARPPTPRRQSRRSRRSTNRITVRASPPRSRRARPTETVSGLALTQLAGRVRARPGGVSTPPRRQGGDRSGFQVRPTRREAPCGRRARAAGSGGRLQPVAD